MNNQTIPSDILSEQLLKEIFPPERSDAFFEALFGDADEGAFDIELIFVHQTESTLELEFRLRQRPGKCLTCNLTFGLPDVFSRHPVIDLQGTISSLEEHLPGASIQNWQLGRTRELSDQEHAIPLTLHLARS